jgi:ribosomal protein S18 acetylase RimI-like enzyme
MIQVLQAGSLAETATHYVHSGDLLWWLFYGPPVSDLLKEAALWDDPAQPGRCLGWMLVDPDWSGFDVFVQPELIGSTLWSGMFDWAETIATAGQKDENVMVHKLWVAETDLVQIAHLETRGFAPFQWDTSFLRSLEDSISVPPLPPGFTLRLCRGLDELSNRAEAQYKAFNNTIPWETYLARFEYFMRSPAYAGALDVVAAADDGRIASFCITWLDEVTQEGHFEPVGTAPDFQGKGLGKAVLPEAMRRLKNAGMRQVSVLTAETNLPACALYRSVGFQSIGRLGCFEREEEILHTAPQKPNTRSRL